MMSRHDLKRNHTKLLRECMSAFAELHEWSFVKDTDLKNGFVALAHADQWVKRADWDLGVQTWNIVAVALAKCISDAMEADSKSSYDLWKCNENFLFFTELLLRVQKHIREVTTHITREYPNVSELPWEDADKLLRVAV